MDTNKMQETECEDLDWNELDLTDPYLLTC